MSAQAEAYYQEQAARIGLEEVPPILSGEPRALVTGEGSYISIQKPDSLSLVMATRRYGEILHSVEPYVVWGAHKEAPQGKLRPNSVLIGSGTKHVNEMIQHYLFPRNVKVGRIHDIQIEAVTPDEVEDSIFNRATQHVSRIAREPKTIENSVFLVTSAALRAGRSLGNVAALTVVYANWWNDDGITPHYLGASYNKNDLLGASALWQSRATRNVIDAWGIQNVVVESVGRGKADHGRGKKQR